MYRECTKEVAECAYRFDYRRCNKGNCPFPNEYEQIKPKIVERVKINQIYFEKLNKKKE
ncbi:MULTISPECIES: hypothetical protein [unclassified Clostridium]|uniref:hypothetical protein n=1 Tax=unclassified Clostridium TaxID=2614128 RepID=UPI000297CC75|nr:MULTISPECIES: hypothetical protein [unclassified Clostridium]EKQ56699.1 MAG: hypothetical protein A370_01774 [Clostridium sp. Maddingley MBC34-26]